MCHCKVSAVTKGVNMGNDDSAERDRAAEEAAALIKAQEEKAALQKLLDEQIERLRKQQRRQEGQ